MAAVLRLLGGLRLDAEQVVLPGRALQKKRLALLALLGSAPAGRFSRDKLAAFLWPDANTERARHQLASSVYELRRALGEDVILASGEELRLNPERLRCDVVEFDAAIAAGELERAVHLYTGPLLDGFFVADAAEFEHWVEAERNRLVHVYARALEQLAQNLEQQNNALGALEYWRRLAAHDAYNSRVALRLMRCLESAGDRAGALQHARTHVVLLREELGVEPDPEITALAERLRSGADDPAASASAPAAPRTVPGQQVQVDPASPVQQNVSPAPAAPTTRRTWLARVVIGLGAASVIAVVAYIAGEQHWQRLLGRAERSTAAASGDLPVVVMMDSPHPSRVYDDETVQSSGTNADILNDVLRDLPIQRVKETVGPSWHRHEEIRQLNPALVLIHLSAFCGEECDPNRVMLRRFIEYLADTKTQFLIYSRMQQDTIDAASRLTFEGLPQRYVGLDKRLHTFGVLDHGTPHWKDPATAAALKLRVKEVLGMKD